MVNSSSLSIKIFQDFKVDMKNLSEYFINNFNVLSNETIKNFVAIVL